MVITAPPRSTRAHPRRRASTTVDHVHAASVPRRSACPSSPRRDGRWRTRHGGTARPPRPRPGREHQRDPLPARRTAAAASSRARRAAPSATAETSRRRHHGSARASLGRSPKGGAVAGRLDGRDERADVEAARVELDRRLLGGVVDGRVHAVERVQPLSTRVAQPAQVIPSTSRRTCTRSSATIVTSSSYPEGVQNSCAVTSRHGGASCPRSAPRRLGSRPGRS